MKRFAMVEWMIVITIVAILVALVVPVLQHEKGNVGVPSISYNDDRGVTIQEYTANDGRKCIIATVYRGVSISCK